MNKAKANAANMVEKPAEQRTAKPKAQPKQAEIMQAEAPAEAQNNEQIDLFDLSQIEWISLDNSTRTVRSPLNLELCASVYCKLNAKNNLTNGRITFSKVLNDKLAENTKIKFGALNGKIVLQLNNQEGFEIRKVSKEDDKKMISSNTITQLIVDKYNIDQLGKTPIFKLKDLGNNFYLLDEIIK